MDKNRVSITEYSTNFDLSRYTKIEDYIYEFRRKRSLVMPYGSILTPTQIIENLDNFINMIDREDKIILTRDYDNSILDEIINERKRTEESNFNHTPKSLKDIILPTIENEGLLYIFP